ncbi:PilZ domain-containing protein [Halomonas nitroreducens]|uniref:Metal-dependent phosphohydrolase n=1 Tax=Halomonas nitroreducens TaxID=447425 RepID=A0A431V280_9GAMM|nr:PilZ domain-containing protein [Halomonas nitroreducens]RTR02047.1 metal-dependent phosphohydrolase [Halomonas nitroreducens]
MASASRPSTPLAQVLNSLLKQEHELSLFSRELPGPLAAEVAEVDPEAGRLALEVNAGGREIERVQVDGTLTLDIESRRPGEAAGHEVYSIHQVTTRMLKIDSGTYLLDCQLPATVFKKESRGDIRIPFILGMQVRVGLEIFRHEPSVSGLLRNLSRGGCMVDIEMADSVALAAGQAVPGVTLVFPNDESFHAEGRIAHLRPFGKHGRAVVGIQFMNLERAQSERLFHFVAEAEREAIYLCGINDKVAGHSSLFIPGAKENKLVQREDQVRRKRARRSPMLGGVLEIAHQAQQGLMFMKNHRRFPEEMLYDGADALLYMLGQDRKAFLYALAFLRDEPGWVRHAVQVAGQLADLLLLRDPHAPQVREAVAGTLLHTLGKPLLISEALPSLKPHMKPHQKEILKGHVTTLLRQLDALGWEPGPTCRDVLENANERLDGSGYPAGKRGDELSELVCLVSVIKVINKLTHECNGVAPRAPLDAYRWVNDRPEAYDKTVLVEYIQHYGLYPIGSLAKFSGGFLAWIMDVDAKGMPCQVNVIKNLAFRDTNIDSVLTSGDFMQIGKLEGVVNPADYAIPPIQH